MAATGSAHGAATIIRLMHSLMEIRSVADIGCARGTWLRVWRQSGIEDVIGVDGAYVDQELLEIPRERFVVCDISASFALGRQFDLAQCMEVAEHLPAARASGLVADLTKLAPVILFSAAPPGQGGEHHVNEQPISYWQGLFDACGFMTIDCLRPLLLRDPQVPIWYRNNSVIFASEAGIARIAPFARQFLLPRGQAAPDVSTLSYRLRKAAIRVLPAPVCNALARWNARRYPSA